MAWRFSFVVLRFYEQSGLLPEPERTAGGYRDYDDAAVERVRFIKAAQGAGLTLAQIGEVLAIRDDGEPPCGHVVELVDERLRQVEQRLAELRTIRAQLRDIADRAASFDPDDCGDYCTLLTDGHQ